MNDTAASVNPLLQELQANSNTLFSEGFQELVNDSKYYDLDEFCKVLSKIPESLSIMYANSRSLPKHITEYRLLLDYIHDKQNFDFDVLCFVETWLRPQQIYLMDDGFYRIRK
jgi:uncharacterized protein YozE (UPF0346 family)